MDPRRIVLNRPVDEKFIDEAAWYARKMLQDRATPLSFEDLFGQTNLDEQSHIHGDAWFTPAGSICQIRWNGNHRLAALGAPCVLFRAHQLFGPFDCTDTGSDENTEDYRRLLQAFDVATFPEGPTFPTEAFSDWPILLASPDRAIDSLRAFEGRTGTRI